MALWAPGRAALLGAVCLGLCGSSGCDRATSGLTVEASASRELWTRSGDAGQDPEQQAYRVEVVIRNRGWRSVSFDEVRAAFIPEEGDRLYQRTFAYDRELGVDAGAYRSGGTKASALRRGKALTRTFSTNGYTQRLTGAGGRPLRFALVLLSGGKSTLGPLAAELPPLGDLPAAGSDASPAAGTRLLLAPLPQDAF